jgi:hypothetical protein
MKGFYFPEEIWNIIKEYNGIVGWKKPIIIFLNKPSYTDLHSVLTSPFAGIFDRPLYNLFYLKIKGITSRRQCRKILIHLFFTTNPSKDEILDLYQEYLDIRRHPLDRVNKIKNWTQKRRDVLNSRVPPQLF